MCRTFPENVNKAGLFSNLVVHDEFICHMDTNENICSYFTTQPYNGLSLVITMDFDTLKLIYLHPETENSGLVDYEYRDVVSNWFYFFCKFILRKKFNDVICLHFKKFKQN